MVISETDEEFLKRCEEYRDERLQLRAWRIYDSGIVRASKEGDRFLDPPEEETGRFDYFGKGKYKS
jgi:hypothetical protein